MWCDQWTLRLHIHRRLWGVRACAVIVSPPHLDEFLEDAVRQERESKYHTAFLIYSWGLSDEEAAKIMSTPKESLATTLQHLVSRCGCD